MENSIERSIDLAAPRDRVWRAITDAREFEQWFRCEIEGEFEVGKIVNCRSRYHEADAEQVTWQKRIVSMEPQEKFVYVWTPGETGADMYEESLGQTTVEFELEERGAETTLLIRESGFANLPEGYGERSFRINTEGWNAQVNNITAYINANS